MTKIHAKIMPDWYLITKYLVLEHDINKGAFRDMLYQKQVEYLAYRQEILDRIDKRITNSGNLKRKNKSISQEVTSAIKLISALHGLDVPKRINQVFGLIASDKIMVAEQKINSTIDLVQCSIDNLRLSNVVEDNSLAQCIDMIYYASHLGVTYKSDRLYKNITLVNDLVEFKIGKDSQTQMLDIIDDYDEYCKWEHYHAIGDDSFADYPTHELSIDSLKFRDKILNREGM